MIVSAFITNKTGDLSTIILKRTPFTPAEVARFDDGRADAPAWCSTAWAPGAADRRTDIVAAAGSARATPTPRPTIAGGLPPRHQRGHRRRPVLLALRRASTT